MARWWLGVVGWCAPTIVVGIEFVTCDTEAGSIVLGDQVFPTAAGTVVEFWEETGAPPLNWRATPKCGESRFSEVEFPDTDNASTDGAIHGRGTLEDNGVPVIYQTRWPGVTSGRVWKFDPVAGSYSAVTATFPSTGEVLDVSVRSYAPHGWVLHYDPPTSRYRVRRWVRSTEGPAATVPVFLTFAPTSGEAPENVDVETPDANYPDGYGWISGGDGAGGPFVLRMDDDQTMWTVPEPPGFTFAYLDTIQVVGTGQAISIAANTSASTDADAQSIFRFLVGDASGVDITDGCTVDGIPYRDWMAATGVNIETQTGNKMAVLGERVAALTSEAMILLGTLIRECP